MDARTLKVDQRTLSALYHASLRSGLTARLGVRWQEPVNGTAEIADVPELVLARFSSRTEDVRRRLVEKLDRFEADLAAHPLSGSAGSSNGKQWWTPGRRRRLPGMLPGCTPGGRLSSRASASTQ